MTEHIPPSRAPGWAPRWAPLTLALALSVTLGACAIPYLKKKSRECPPAVTLADASSITRFVAGGGPGLADATFQAKVKDVALRCTHDRNSQGYGYINLKANVMIQVDRGLANRDGLARFTYFISIADSSRRILSKEVFPVDVVFPAGKNQSRLKDRLVSVRIPIKGDQTARDFEIFVGFQLTRGELEYNRRLTAR